VSEPTTPEPDDQPVEPSAAAAPARPEPAGADAPAPAAGSSSDPEPTVIPRRGLIIRVVIITLLTAGTIWAFVQPDKKDDTPNRAPVSTSVNPR
jgi:hypothetical protein